jgi:hypothetical protein
MPNLDSQFFSGGGDIPTDIAAKLSVKYGAERDREVLTKLGWEGQLIGYAGLNISPDGSKVNGARFAMQGALAAQPVEFQAAKLWDAAGKDVTVTIDIPDAAMFRFASSTLYSDYLAQEECKYKVMKAGVRASRDEEAGLGVGSFCLRLFAYLDKGSNARSGPGPHFKAMVLIFPDSVEGLEELSSLTLAPGWPGLKLLEAKAEMFPRAQRNTWGAPLFPLLVITQRSGAADRIPSGEWLRFALAGLLRTAVLPTACAGRRSLTVKCQGVLDAGQDPLGRSPTITWPQAPEPAAERGIAFV